MATYNYQIDMTAKGTTPLRYIPLTDVGGVSIDCQMLKGGATFNSGILEVKKANSMSGSRASLSTAVTITAPGFTDLTAAYELSRAAYLVIECTTAASSSTIVQITVNTI